MHYYWQKEGAAMKFNILEMFITFWASALLWLLVEYLYSRIHKNHGANTTFEHYHDK